jgi:hypothetical protein
MSVVAMFLLVENIPGLAKWVLRWSLSALSESESHHISTKSLDIFCHQRVEKLESRTVKL